MQLTLYREEVNMKKVNQWSDQEVTPLVIKLHDTDSITDQTLDGVRAELTQQGWNKTQAVYAEMIVKLFGKDILVKDVKLDTRESNQNEKLKEENIKNWKRLEVLGA